MAGAGAYLQIEIQHIDIATNSNIDKDEKI